MDNINLVSARTAYDLTHQAIAMDKDFHDTLESISKQINIAIKLGKFEVTVDRRYISERVVRELTNLGYSVEMVSRLLYSESTAVISWQFPEK